MFKKAYTFDDVALVPQYNNIPSRTEPQLETWMTSHLKMDIPILASPMDTVIGPELADILLNEGSLPIYHRFTNFETQMKWVQKYSGKTFISCGLRNFEQTRALLDAGALGVCIDIAHGHSHLMLEFIEKLKKHHPNHSVIAGSVCTTMAYHDLANAGADAIRVGIGAGAACTTRVVTGFGVPQFSAIYDCAKIAEKLRIPLIADGGIRTSRDVVLALAAGASTVMVGKLFALTLESASQKHQDAKTGKILAKYRGQASEDFQRNFYGGLKEKTVPEGVDFLTETTGSAQKLIAELLGGIRSGLTYGGARNIKELQRKAEFTEVTPSYILESYPRKMHQASPLFAGSEKTSNNK